MSDRGPSEPEDEERHDWWTCPCRQCGLKRQWFAFTQGAGYDD